MRLKEALLTTTLMLTTPMLSGDKPSQKIDGNRKANSAEVEKVLLREVREKIRKNDRCEHKWRRIGEEIYPVDIGPEDELVARQRFLDPNDEFFDDLDPVESGYYFNVQQVTLMCIRAVLGDDLLETEKRDGLECTTGAITRFPVEYRLSSSDPTISWLIFTKCN